MKTDKELEQLVQPIIEIYNKIELELLINIAERFANYQQVGIVGSLEWYNAKLDELGGLNADAVNIISEYTGITKKEIYRLLEQAGYTNIDKQVINTAYDVGLANVDYDTLIKSKVFSQVINNSYKELNETFRLINTKAIESTKKAYIDVLNQSYLEVSSGIYDYNTSIRKAIQTMVDNGITCATYRRKNGKTVNYSIEGIVRRDTLTAVYQTANKETDELAEAIGSDYVEVSSHYNARVSDRSEIANHAGWQGKIYKLHGFDKNYGNFYVHCGEGDIEGFGGVNCRHLKHSFIPGVSIPQSVQYDYDEVEKAYKLSKKQRDLERQVRKEKQHVEVAKTLNDEEYLKKHQEELKQKQLNLKTFCEENDLIRDYNREFVGKISPHSFNEELEDHVNKFDFLSKEIEHLMYVDIETGEQIGKTFTGTSNHVSGSISTELLLKTKKEGSILAIHNHPNNSSFSFGDLLAFNQSKQLGAMGVVTDDSLYLLTTGKNGTIKWKKKEIDAQLNKYRSLEKDVADYYSNLSYIERKHIVNKVYCEKMGWKYDKVKKEKIFQDNN